jgi:hypothetical protein
MAKWHFTIGFGIALGLLMGLVAGEVRAADNSAALRLVADQKEFLHLEPILVTLRLNSAVVEGLPATPGESKWGTLRFEIDPSVKPRKDAKALPLESQEPEVKAKSRIYDLMEWFSFPDKGGTWTARAVFEHRATKLVSEPITITVRKPAKGDAEFEPVARLHHTPWSNYDTNSFCGDTFDLVQKWPTSRFARYCHYWNGRYLQNKKEFDKAITSYRTVVDKYPDFVLADAAAYGIAECLYAQKKVLEAQTALNSLRKKLEGAAGNESSTPKTALYGLADAMARRIKQNSGTE